MELWDIYDKNRKPTGRTHVRGEPLPAGDYHLVVRAWIVNSKGEFLITKRAPEKLGFPGYWETPAGSALTGEDSLTAVIREVKEESGIDVKPENGVIITSIFRHNRSNFWDIWLFRCEFDMNDVALQPGETVDAKKATWDEIAGMMENSKFVPLSFYPEFEMLKNMI